MQRIQELLAKVIKPLISVRRIEDEQGNLIELKRDVFYGVVLFQYTRFEFFLLNSKCFGNCFTPAIHVQRFAATKPGVATTTITFRFNFFGKTSKFAETTVYFRYDRILPDVHSEHIAQAFGELVDDDHGGTYYYNGVLGNHISA